MRRAPAAWRNARRFVPSPLSSSPCFYSFVRDSQSALRSPLRISVFDLAGAEGFEPPSPVLETGSLTVELTPLNAAARYSPFALRFQFDPSGKKRTAKGE